MRACASLESSIWMFQVRADTDVPLPAGGDGAGGASTSMKFTLRPGLSNCSLSCWTPAAKVTGTITVVHVCHAPVAGMVTLADTVAEALNPTRIAAPAGDATRSCKL